ncbi:hypothetical protein CYMTET_30390 [Cymbomonas tetramitiformis]|uniref:Uncharacterized protein n=1 Tax=Cymbomonas tetramitiformis TaxID=36881 RepID=A0AAE0FJ34_9CHLO|nr:hypothetical protein CYMTET_30390 [Cymbomonas tetramitiformis]
MGGKKRKTGSPSDPKGVTNDESPLDIETRETCASALRDYRKGQREKACKSLIKASKKDTRSELPHRCLARLHHHDSHCHKAANRTKEQHKAIKDCIEAAEEALRRAPQSLSVYCLLGAAAVMGGGRAMAAMLANEGRGVAATVMGGARAMAAMLANEGRGVVATVMGGARRLEQRCSGRGVVWRLRSPGGARAMAAIAPDKGVVWRPRSWEVQWQGGDGKVAVVCRPWSWEVQGLWQRALPNEGVVW